LTQPAAQKLRRADPEAAICANTGARPLGAKQGDGLKKKAGLCHTPGCLRKPNAP
jgi:hypothetical protein